MESDTDNRPIFTADSRIGLTVSNLITIGVVVAGVVTAWTKVPTTSDVNKMAANAANAAIEKQRNSNKEQSEHFDRRLNLIETNLKENRSELTKLNGRMDYILIMMAGSSADDFHSQKAKVAVERVRRNLKTGGDPLEGLPWNKPDNP